VYWDCLDSALLLTYCCSWNEISCGCLGDNSGMSHMLLVIVWDVLRLARKKQHSVTHMLLVTRSDVFRTACKLLNNVISFTFCFSSHQMWWDSLVKDVSLTSYGSIQWCMRLLQKVVQCHLPSFGHGEMCKDCQQCHSHTVGCGCGVWECLAKESAVSLTYWWSWVRHDEANGKQTMHVTDILLVMGWDM